MTKTQCRCHGASGACVIKTCWRSLAPFAKIGDKLKKAYGETAVQVSKRKRKRLRPVDKSKEKRSLKSRSLVFISRSPDFCVAHPKLGIFGVKGKYCAVWSNRLELVNWLPETSNIIHGDQVRAPVHILRLWRTRTKIGDCWMLKLYVRWTGSTILLTPSVSMHVWTYNTVLPCHIFSVTLALGVILWQLWRILPFIIYIDMQLL